MNDNGQKSLLDRIRRTRSGDWFGIVLETHTGLKITETSIKL